MVNTYNSQAVLTSGTRFWKWFQLMCVSLSFFGLSANAQVCSGPPSSAGTASATPASICSGSTTSIASVGAATDPGVTYQWYSSLVSGGPYSPVSGANATTYSSGALTATVYYVLSVQCSATLDSVLSNEITVTVNTNTVTITPASPGFCPGGSVTLTSTGFSGGNVWSTTQTTDAIIVNTAATYSVVNTDANGCTATASTSVAANAAPTAAPTASCSSLYPGSTSTLTANATAGSGTISSYSWALNGNPIVGATSATYTTLANANGSYTVTVTNSNGCSFTSSGVAITNASGPLSGTYSIGTGGCNFLTIASAVTYLNANGVSGPVIFNVAAGETEIAPVGGIKLGSTLLNASTSATNTITFQKSGAGADPLITAYVGTSTTVDGIFIISGTDYLTIDGIDLNDPNSGSPACMEAGYALVNLNAVAPFDGCQFDVIKNCTITLNRANPNGAFGIFSSHSVSTSTTALTITAASDAHSNNKFYSNTISNVDFGFYMLGFNAATPYSLYDQNNDIGGTSLATGNTMTNLGGNAAFGCYGVGALYQNNCNVSYNTVNNALGGVNNTSQLYGIYVFGTNSTFTTNNNTITLKEASSSTGSTLYGIYCNSTSSNVTANNNNINVQEISGSAIVASATYFTGGTNVTMNNNTASVSAGVSGATLYGLWTTNTGVININTNTVSINSTATIGSGSVYWIYASGTATSETVTNNIIASSAITGTGSFYVFYMYNGTSNVTITGNSITSIARTGTGGSTYILYNTYGANTAGTNTISNNNFSNISNGASTSTVYGIYFGNNNTLTISNNTINNISGTGAGSFYGIYPYFYGSNVTINNNTVSNINWLGFNATIYGLYYYGYYSTLGNVYNNNFFTFRSAGAKMVGMDLYYTGSANVGTYNFYNNKVYDLASTSTSAVVDGIRGDYNYYGGTVNIYNNYIGGLSAIASTNASSMNGINLACSTFPSYVTQFNISYNTIYLNGVNGGLNGGSSGFYSSTAVATYTLKDNIIDNQTSFNGTGKTVAIRRSTTTLTPYFNTTSNKNLYYAGTPSANNLIYYDGTNSLQTLAAYKAFSGISPRDQASVTENVTFLSTTGSSSTYLHIDPTVATFVESGGLPVSGITTDYDGDVRNASTPDIGADEGSFLNITPLFTSVAASPATGQCTAVSHSISATVVPGGANPVTSVLINYSLNGVAQTAIPMSHPTGNNWTGSIPAAVPSSAVVAWSLTATDGTYTVTSNGISYQDNYLTTLNAFASPSTVCAGVASTLVAGGLPPTAPSTYANGVYTTGAGSGDQITNVTLGSINNSTGASSSPYNTYYSALNTNLTAGTAYTLTGTINNGGTETAAAWIDYNHNGVFESSEKLGENTSLTYSIPFTVPTSAYNGVTRMRVRGVYSSTGLDPYASYSYGEVEDYNVTISNGQAYVLPSNFVSYSWSDGTNTVGTTNPTSVAPSVAGSYSYFVVATDANGCSITSSSATLTVNAVPTAPTATNSTQCGQAVPSCSVSGGTAYNWYLAATGGSPIQSSSTNHLTSYSISTTTTFYVSSVNPSSSCESLTRTPVLASVQAPDAVSASSNLNNVCPGTAITVTATQTGSNNTYSYSWNGTPAGSGMTSGTTGASVIITPTLAGTYTYTVTATDAVAGCVTTATVNVTMNATPVAIPAVITPTNVCLGSSVALNTGAGGTAPSGYCAVTNGGSACITNVTFNTLNRTSGCQVSPYYESVPEATATTTVSLGQTYSFSITTPADASYSTAITSVWIDWNRNGVYEASEWYQPYTSGNTITIPITVPLTASTGKTGMRVRSRGAGNPNAATDGCTAMGSGETEDYTINIDPNPGATYAWSTSPAVANEFAFTQSATATPTSVGTTTYYAILTGTNGCTLAIPATVTVNAIPTAPTASNSVQCGSGIPTASVTSTTGLPTPIFKWYAAASGGSPLQSSTATTYGTLITATTTFYVSETGAAIPNCEGPRTPVTVTVNQPDAVSASVSAGPYCLGSSITLTATQTGSTNSYTYAWNGSPFAGSGFAGSAVLGPLTTLYSNDFSTSASPAVLAGVAALSSGTLLLTPNTTSQQGGITVTGGSSTDYLAVDFDMSVLGAGGADGLSYSFGDDVSASASTPNPEDGTGTKLKVAFDAYGTMPGGQGIYLMYNNNTSNPNSTDAGVLAYSSNGSWVNTANVHVSLVVDQTGLATLIVGGTTIFSNVQLPAAYTSASKASWNHVIKARTGGLSESHAIDNLIIKTKQYQPVSIPGNPLTVTPTAAGTYTYNVTATDAGAGCNAVSSVTVTIGPLPTVVSAVASPLTVCSGSPVTLTAGVASGSTATSYPASNATSAVDEEIWNVTFGSMNNTSGCAQTGTGSSILNEYSDYTSSVAVPTVSQGQVVPVSITVGYCPYVSSYSNVAAMYIDYNHNGVFTDAGEQVFTTAYGPASSTGVAYPGSITIPATATGGITRLRVVLTEGSSVSSAGTYTWGETEDYNINIDPNPGATYTWLQGATTVATGSPATVSPTTVGANTYYALITSPSGCTANTTSVTVTVNPLPTSPTTTPSTQCGAGVPTAHVTSTSGAATPGFNWYTAATGGTPIQSSLSTTLTSYSVNVTTTLYVSEVNLLTSCESARTPVLITVNQPDVVTATSSLSTVCLGQPITITATQTGTTNTYAYSWNGSPILGSGLTSGSTAASQTITPTIAGTYNYTVTAIDATAGCTYISSVSVVVRDIPNIVAITGNPDSTLCAGLPVTVSGYVGSGSGSTAMPTGYCVVTNAGTACITNVNFGSINRTSPGCESVTSTDYSIVPEATATTLVAPGQTYTFSLTLDGNAGIASVWIDYNRNGVYEASEWQQVFTSATSGTINITIPVTASSGKTGMRVRSRLSGNQNGAGDGCLAMGSGETEDYTISILDGGPGTWSWTDGGSFSATTNTFTTTPPAGVTTTYTGTYNDGFCTATRSIHINSVILNSAPVVTANPTSICNSGTTTLSVANIAAGAIYQWASSTDGGLTWTDISGANASSYTSDVLTSSIAYHVSVTCGTSTPMVSATTSIVVNTPSITTSSAGTVCGPQNAIFTATGVGTINWYADATTTTVLATGSPVSIYAPYTTAFWVEASYGTTCVSGRTPVIVTVNPSTPILVVATPDSICQGQSTTVSVSSTDLNYSYSWNGLGTGSSFVVSPTANTTYNVTAYDAVSGCGALGSVAVTVNAVPSAPVITTTATFSCAGNPVTLTASSSAPGLAVVGTGTDQNSGSTEPAPYGNYWTAHHEQYLVLASELSASGIVAGPITSLGFDIASIGATNGIQNLQMSLALTTATAMTGTMVTGLTNVYSYPGVYYNTVGWSSNVFTTPFMWDGTSNLVVDISMMNCTTCPATSCTSYTNNDVVNMTTTSFTATNYAYGDGDCSIITSTPGTVNTTSQRPNMRFGAIVSASGTSTYNWSTGQSGASVTVVPTSTTNVYSATATSAFGCVSAPGNITITTSPALNPVIVGGNINLCYPDVVTLSVVDTGVYSSGYPTGTVIDWVNMVPNQPTITSAAGSDFQVKVTLPVTGCYAFSAHSIVNTKTVAVTSTVTAASCGLSNGYMKATVNTAVANPGIAPFRYVWKNSLGTVIRDVTTSSTFDDTTNVAGDSYSVTVFDNVGGSNSCNSGAVSVIVSNTGSVTATVTSVTNLACPGGLSGAATLSITGGLPPITIHWSNGTTTANLSGVAGGTYIATVTDGFGCFDTALAVITEPLPFSYVITPSSVSCFGGSDGGATVVISGGTAPYDYSWYDASFSSDLGDNAPLTGQTADTYILYLNSDANTCLDNVNPNGIMFSIGSPNATTITSFSPSSNSVGTPVTISGSGFTGATAVSFNGTPASFFVTSDGSITATVPSGATTGTISVTVGSCGSTTSTGVFTVISSKLFTLHAYIEAYYIGSGQMNSVLMNEGISIDPNEMDTLHVELRDQTDPTIVIGAANAVMNVSGYATFALPGTTSAGSYYVAIFHRNALQTWSAAPITFTGSNNDSLDITTDPTTVYSSNLKDLGDGNFGMYSGDMNQDEYVDIFDFPDYDFDVLSGVGNVYVKTDLNGDGYVDIFDFPIFDANSLGGIYSIHP